MLRVIISPYKIGMFCLAVPMSFQRFSTLSATGSGCCCINQMASYYHITNSCIISSQTAVTPAEDNNNYKVIKLMCSQQQQLHINVQYRKNRSFNLMFCFSGNSTWLHNLLMLLWHQLNLFITLSKCPTYETSSCQSCA